MPKSSPSPKPGRLSRARGLFRRGQNLVFNVLSVGLGLAGVFLLGVAIDMLVGGDPYSLVGFGVGLVLVSYPVVVFRERARDRALANFLVAHADRLAEGVEGPGDRVYTLETVFVRYRSMLSLVVLTLSFDSGLYLEGPSHRIPKALYTLFTALFGWWTLNWQVWIENLAVIGGNLSDSHRVTVAELLGIDLAPPGADETRATDPSRRPG